VLRLDSSGGEAEEKVAELLGASEELGATQNGEGRQWPWWPCLATGRRTGRESRKKRREGKEEGLCGAVEKLQGIASVARTASRMWPVSSRKPPRRSFL
jgi:hypothetical protein